MVSPIAQMNANRRLAQGVAFRPPAGMRFAASVAPLPRRPPQGGDLADQLGAASATILTHPAFQQQPAPSVKDQAVHGLGWLIGNPVSQAVLKPLTVLDYPRAGVTGVIRQLLETGALEQANQALAKLPGIDYTPIARPEGNEAGFQWGEVWRDFKRHEGFGSSIIEPQFGGEGYEGADPWNIWYRRGLGFAGDVAADPLMKLSTGTHAASGLESRFNYVNKLAEAQRAAGVESTAAREAAEFAAEHALLGGTGAAEAERATAAAAEAYAQRLEALGGNEAIDLINRRGVNVASPEQLRAMGAPQHAVRFAGMAIPGRASEATSRAMSRFLSPGKELWSRTAGAAGRRIITPKGVIGQTLRPATERLVRGEGPMSRELALATHAVNETMRVGAGDFRGPARAYHHQLAESLRGMSREEREALVRAAEETGVENAVTKMGPQMIETIKEAYRRAGIPEDMLDDMVPELRPWRLPNGEMSRYTMPHVLSRSSFRFFNRLRKGQNPLLDYIRRDLGITDRDLLEEGGFLQRRLFRPNADGSPQTFKIGKDEITITTGSLAELEDKLGGLLRSHGFEGKLYETDPVEAWRRYIASTEKDVARRIGAHEATRLGLAGYAPDLPHAWDPYGREVKMVPAPGETEPRYVRARTTEQRPALPKEYEWAEDEAATAARNKIILEGGEKGATQQVLNEFREAAGATRENLARQIENTRQYTAKAFEQARAKAGKSVDRAEAIVTRSRGVVDKLEQEYLELLKETSANEQLIRSAEGTIHGIRSQTPKNIRAAQQQRLADIAERLQFERDRLDSLQQGLQNALAADEAAEMQARFDRIAQVDEAYEDAAREFDRMKGKAQQAVARRISRESKGKDHLISAIENRQAREVLGNREAAERAQELLARRERYAAVQGEQRAEALRLQEQADRIDELLSRRGAGSAPRTEGKQTRLEGWRQQQADEVARLRREARTAQNKSNAAARSVRDVERRIADDEWLQAQRTVDQYVQQQARVANYSDNFGVDMPAAQARLNKAQRDVLELRQEEQAAARQAFEAEQAAATPAATVEPVRSLQEILGDDVRVRYHKSEAPEPARRPDGTLPEAHVLEVSLGDEAVGNIMWDAETGKVQIIFTADEYRRQGVATAMFDQATQYSEAAGLTKPKHAPGEQTAMGAAWAPEADARIAARPESMRPKGAESPVAQQARQALDNPRARGYLADEQIAEGLQREIDELSPRPGGRQAPAEWNEVGRKPVKEPRANQRWRAYNSRRRKLLGDIERVRGEAELTPPITPEQFRAESTKAPKPRSEERLPKFMEQYRTKPSGRRLRGKEPWWLEEYGPGRPNLTSSQRSRTIRLRKLQEELDTVESWLAKHPQPPHPTPKPHVTRLRARIGGKLIKLDRETGVGARGGATWKITLPDGTEHSFIGSMADAMNEGERLGHALARQVPETEALAELRQRLATIRERLAAAPAELKEQIARERQVLTHEIQAAQLPRSPAPFTQEFPPVRQPTREELVRQRFEPNIEQARQRVQRFGAIHAGEETEGIRRTIQEAADARIAGLQGEVGNLRFQQQRLGEMITDLYQNRMPDPVADWNRALENAAQARQLHEQINQYISDYATRQRALDIVEKNARRGAPTAEDLKRVARRELRPEDAQGLIAAVDDVNRWMQNAGQVLPVGVRNRIEAALMAHEQALASLTTTNDLPASALAKIQREAANGKLAPVLKAQLREAYRTVGADGEIIIDREIARQLFGVEQVLDSKLFGRLFTTWTNFFKTYATLTPGFHVRNALSAILMNATEGVGVREQLRALRLWKRFRAADDPLVFLRSLTEQERNAFRATFASGAGGQFLEGGVGEARAGAGRAAERAFANPATRLSKRMGEWVEGPQRLALGLHTTARGGTVNEALARITRIHFDYGQVSKFDEQMKRIIPFWTFMSRNVPLQFTQMWMRPKAYLKFQSALRNLQLGNEDQPIIPSYITQAGGTYFGAKTPEWASKIPVVGPPAGMPIVVQPDLPHTRYADDLQRLQNALSGQGLGQMATNLNPMITVPAEFVSRTDFFTGQRFDPTDKVRVGGAMLPYAAALALVGQAQRGPDGNWYVDAAALNAVRGLDPNLDRMMRLAPQLAGLEGEDRTGASTTARQAESWARWAGLPVRTISEQQQRSELRRQAFEERDRRALQAAMGG